MSNDHLAQFKAQRFTVIPNALSTDEVRRLNEAIDKSMKHFPELWYGKERKQSVQCLLAEPEFDLTIRHPAYFPIIRQAFGDNAAFAEFSAMVRQGGHTGATVEGWHRDFAPDTSHPQAIRAISVIIYLTEVDKTTARLCVVPGSSLKETAPVLLSEENDRYEAEVEVMGPPGTAAITDASNWHCAKWGKGPRQRRTIHLYFQSSTIPPVSNQNITPRRLWDSPDPQLRKFYSHQNALTRAVTLDYVR
jgi:ectoine hydroxylase-related dioxygenase (phytanoyl-CoA dioxygenase family)